METNRQSLHMDVSRRKITTACWVPLAGLLVYVVLGCTMARYAPQAFCLLVGCAKPIGASFLALLLFALTVGTLAGKSSSAL